MLSCRAWCMVLGLDLGMFGARLNQQRTKDKSVDKLSAVCETCWLRVRVCAVTPRARFPASCCWPGPELRNQLRAGLCQDFAAPFTAAALALVSCVALLLGPRPTMVRMYTQKGGHSRVPTIGTPCTARCCAMS